MTTGLALPVGVDKTGGAALVSGEDNDQKLIYTALSDCDNENAFQQDIGLGGDIVFDVNDSKIRARVLRKLIAIFDDFETNHKYKLLTESIEWEESTPEGVLVLKFKYLNLETDETSSFKQFFQGAR